VSSPAVIEHLETGLAKFGTLQDLHDDRRSSGRFGLVAIVVFGLFLITDVVMTISVASVEMTDSYERSVP
jgi:hypothetical protein